MAPDAQQEVFMVGIKNELDASEVQFAAFTEDLVDVDYGKRGMEGIVLLNGGRLRKFLPQENGKITLKCYPIGIASNGTGVMQYLHPNAAIDSTDPYACVNTLRKKFCRIVLLWAETLPATASAQTTSSNGFAERLTVINAFCTEVKPDYTDKMKSVEITFEWTPFDKTGVSNAQYESTDGTGLAAVVATAIAPNAQWT